MSLKVKIKADASQFNRTMSKTKKSVRGFGKSLMGIKSALAGVAVAMGAAFATRKIFDFIASSSKAASSVESLTTQFTTLLGSTEKAEERMKELVEFAAKTPFEVEGLSRTSKLLQTLGGSMLATGNGLRMVGDAAALAGQPLEEVGLHVGRLFNAITSGTSAGESVNRLQELGLITGKVKIGFEELGKAQKSGKTATLSSATALKLLQHVLASSEGSMAKLAETTEGKMSMVKDAVFKVKSAFGTGFNDGLKVALDAMSSGIPKLADKAAEMGDVIGKGIAEAVNGDVSRMVQIGELIGQAISGGVKLGIKQAMFSFSESLWKGLEGDEQLQLGKFMDNVMGGRVSADVKATRKMSARSDVSDLVQSLKAGFRELQTPIAIPSPTGPVPGQPDYRYANDGEAATLLDGKRVVRILESIDRSLSQPFPN
jgi:hypothetical protein